MVCCDVFKRITGNRTDRGTVYNHIHEMIARVRCYCEGLRTVIVNDSGAFRINGPSDGGACGNSVGVNGEDNLEGVVSLDIGELVCVLIPNRGAIKEHIVDVIIYIGGKGKVLITSEVKHHILCRVGGAVFTRNNGDGEGLDGKGCADFVIGGDVHKLIAGDRTDRNAVHLDIRNIVGRSGKNVEGQIVPVIHGLVFRRDASAGP